MTVSHTDKMGGQVGEWPREGSTCVCPKVRAGKRLDGCLWEAGNGAIEIWGRREGVGEN